jgi:orotate phosphoribosyltransferase
MTKNNSLIESLYKIGAVKFGSFTLKSGQNSKIYMDLRQIVSHPAVLRHVAEAIWEKVSSAQFDMVCGIPYTALPIATCISLLHNIPMIMRRKEKKDYGTKQQIEGAYKAGQYCLIIEDVITSGMSIMETTDELEAAGLKITDVAVLIDREQGARENLEKRNYHVHAALTLKQILKTLLQSTLLPSDEREIVNELLSETI